MRHPRLAAIALFSLAAPMALAQEAACNAEYERGRREMGAWAEMAGIVEGTVYGYSLMQKPGRICLTGTPKEKVKAIAKAFISEQFRKAPVPMDDVPSEQEAVQFLERFFPCPNARPNQAPSASRPASRTRLPVPSRSNARRCP